MPSAQPSVRELYYPKDEEANAYGVFPIVIPIGYRVLDFRPPLRNEWYMSIYDTVLKSFTTWPAKERRIILERMVN